MMKCVQKKINELNGFEEKEENKKSEFNVSKNEHESVSFERK